MNLTDDEIRVKCAEAMGVKTTVFRGHLVDAITLCDTIPDYPNDPAAALTLCDRLRSEGWCLQITYGVTDKWTVTFYQGQGRFFTVQDPSLPRAICLPFLKVKDTPK